MESDDSERLKKLEAGKEKVGIEPCDVAKRAKFINFGEFAFQLLFQWRWAVRLFFPLQLKMFQKKKSATGTKKKKKKDRSSTSGSAQSPSPGERRRRSASRDRVTKPVQPEAAVAVEEKLPQKEGEDVEVEEISQADTDRDAPSIASELGSPIPFDVSL